MGSDWLPPQPPEFGTPAPAAPERPRPPFPPEQQPQQQFPPAQQPQLQFPPAQQPQQPVFVRPQPGGGPGGLPVAALVCGIAGVALLLVSAGLWFVLTLPLSGAAWVCAALARRRIRSGVLPPAGAGMAKAGLVLGIVGVALGIVAAVVWIALLASGVDVEKLLEDLRDELEQQRNQQRDPPGDQVSAFAGAAALGARRAAAGAAGVLANLRRP